jgi:hypothetical protein
LSAFSRQVIEEEKYGKRPGLSREGFKEEVRI